MWAWGCSVSRSWTSWASSLRSMGISTEICLAMAEVAPLARKAPQEQEGEREGERQRGMESGEEAE